MLVIGIGNPMRRDDGAGAAVVRRLQQLSLSGLVALEHPGDGLALIDRWSNHDRVCLVDAARSGVPVGSIQLFDVVSAPLPGNLLHYSSHLFGVVEAVELARLQGRLPEQLQVIAIEGGDFGFGTGLSSAVSAGVTQVVQSIADGQAQGPGASAYP